MVVSYKHANDWPLAVFAEYFTFQKTHEIFARYLNCRSVSKMGSQLTALRKTFVKNKPYRKTTSKGSAIAIHRILRSYYRSRELPVTIIILFVRLWTTLQGGFDSVLRSRCRPLLLILYSKWYFEFPIWRAPKLLMDYAGQTSGPLLFPYFATLFNGIVCARSRGLTACKR